MNKKRRNKTGATGVSLLKSGRFRAVLNGEYLGNFATVEDAAAARAKRIADMRVRARRNRTRLCRSCGRSFLVAPTNDDVCFVCKGRAGRHAKT